MHKMDIKPCMHSRQKANGLCLKGCVVHNYIKLSVGIVLEHLTSPSKKGVGTL